jgi:hypothetical protein
LDGETDWAPAPAAAAAVVQKLAAVFETTNACVLAALSNGNAAACPEFAASPRFIGNPEVAEIGTIRGMGYS